MSRKCTPAFIYLLISTKLFYNKKIIENNSCKEFNSHLSEISDLKGTVDVISSDPEAEFKEFEPRLKYGWYKI